MTTNDRMHIEGVKVLEAVGYRFNGETWIEPELTPREALPPHLKELDSKLFDFHHYLRSRLGEEVWSSWFKSMQLEHVNATGLVVSVPVKFLKTWIESHYMDAVERAALMAYKTDRVEIVARNF